MKKLASYLNLVVAVILLLVVSDTKPKEKFVGPVEQVINACVEIHVEGVLSLHNPLTGDTVDKKVGILGSGVFISNKGYILTAAHLFKDFKSISSISVISPSGDTVFGSVIKISPTADLAVIKADYYHKTPKVKLADPRSLKVGQEVFAIGSPLGLSFSVSHGILSALYRDFDHAYNVTQSDTSINPGNSGGPLFNLKGELVGINVFMISDNPLFPTFSGLGFSEQCGEIRKFLTDVKKIDKGLVL